MTKLLVRKIVIILSLSAYLYLLKLNAIFINGDKIPSYMIAIIGWTSIFISIGNFSWIANPIYFLALWNFSKNRLTKAILQCFSSFVLGISLTIFDTIAINESGALSKITSFEMGYWIWISCFFCTFVTMLIYKWTVKTE